MFDCLFVFSCMFVCVFYRYNGCIFAYGQTVRDMILICVLGVCGVKKCAHAIFLMDGWMLTCVCVSLFPCFLLVFCVFFLFFFFSMVSFFLRVLVRRTR